MAIYTNLQIKINNNTVNSTSGIQVHKNVADELQRTELFIPNCSILNISRYDVVSFSDIDFFLVFDIDRETIIGENLYNYRLTLVDATVKLQNYNMPNVAITQPLDNKRSIKYQINRMLSIAKFKEVFDDTKLTSDFDTTCPEGQYEGRTLFEILVDLGGIIGYRPLIIYNDSDDFELIFQNIDEIPSNSLDSLGLIQERYIEKGDEFITGIELNVENAVANSQITTGEGAISCRSNDYIMDDDNASVILSNDIANIKQITAKMPTYGTSYDITYYIRNHIYTDSLILSNSHKVNITQFVVDKTVYNTKLIADNSAIRPFIYDFSEPNDDNPSYYKIIGKNENILDYKQWFLYFSGNEIGGLGQNLNSKIFGLTTGSIAVCEAAWIANLWNWYDNLTDHEKDGLYLPDMSAHNTPATNFKEEPRNILFYLNYDNYNNLRIVTNKYDLSTKINRCIKDSQDNASVVYEKLIDKQDDKITRYGEPIYICKMIYNDDIMLFNDINGSSYITRNNIKYYLYDYILEYNTIGCCYFTGKFVKNRVKKNIYTGINNKIRYTSLMSQNEALFRQDLFNYKMFLTEDASGDGFTQEIVDDPATASILFENRTNVSRFSMVLKPDSSQVYFIMPNHIMYKNNSLLIETHFKSNTSAGLIVSSSDTSRTICKDALYTDENGEFEDLTIGYYDINGSETQVQCDFKPYLTNEYGGEITTTNDEKTITGVFKDNKEQYSVCCNYTIGSGSKNINVYKDFMNFMEGSTQYLFIYEQQDLRRYLISGNYDATDPVIISRTFNRITLNTNYLIDSHVNIDYVESWGMGIKIGDKYFDKFEVFRDEDGNLIDEIYLRKEK